MGWRKSHLADDPPGTINMRLGEVVRGVASEEGFIPLTHRTSRGDIESRYYEVKGAKRAAIFVGGAGGGFDTPVRGWLYPWMCKDLQARGIIAMRVKYRRANDLEECALDVLAGVSHLESQGITSIALVGHSFGGAVVIQAAALSPTVKTCVPMSTQTYGATPASTLGPRCSMLLAHGTDDEILPADCSRMVYKMAKEPKKLLLKEGARHGLDEWSDELPSILLEWIDTQLPK